MTFVDVLLVLARVGLALVFAFAAVGKLADRPRFMAALGAFGVPRGLAAFVGTALPLVELVIAAALIPSRSAVLGAVVALGLLATLSAAIVANMVRGRHPPCGCFGQHYPAPVSYRTLIRNGLLAGVAAAILVAGQHRPAPSAAAWVSRSTATDWVFLGLGLVLTLVIVVQHYSMVNLVRQQGRLLLRVEALEALAGIDTSHASTGGLDVTDERLVR